MCRSEVRLAASLWLVFLVGCGAATPPTEEQETAENGVVPSGLFKLQYRIEGEGTPAIVIGFPNYYARVFSQDLRSHLRLVFVDHRGSAASPGKVETEEFTLDRIVDDIELVRETLGLGRVAVIGHSGHAFMALEYAKKYPANVSHVIMIGIAPDFSASSGQAAQASWEELASPERKATLEENRRNITDEELAGLPPGERFIKNYIRNGPFAWYDSGFDSTLCGREWISTQTCSTTFRGSCSETSTSLAVWISSIDPFSWRWGDTTSWSPRHRPGSPSKTVSAISPSVFLKTVDIPPSTKSPTCSTERS